MSYWNPAPALIATHYNENIDQCFAVWLETTTITSHTHSSPEKGLSNLQECVENALKLRCLASLHLGYRLFLPDSVCVPLVNFLRGFLIDKDYFSGKPEWKRFLDKFSKLKPEADIVRTILIYGVLNCESVHEQRNLFRTYKSLPADLTPDFGYFGQILESVAEVDWDLPFQHLLLATEIGTIEALLRREATRLIDRQLYEVAIRFSRVACLSLDDVLCEMLDHQLATRTAARSRTDPTNDYETSIDSTCSNIIDQMAEVRSRHLSRKEMSWSFRKDNRSLTGCNSISRTESVGSVVSAGSSERKVSVLAAQRSIDDAEVKERSFWDRAQAVFRRYCVKDTTAFSFFVKKSEQVESLRDKFIAMKYALKWIDSEVRFNNWKSRRRVDLYVLYTLLFLWFPDLILTRFDLDRPTV